MPANADVELYVLNQFDDGDQKVRVVIGSVVWVGVVIRMDNGELSIGMRDYEMAPPKGTSVATTFHLNRFQGGLYGTTNFEYFTCSIRAPLSADQGSLPRMGYATQDKKYPSPFLSMPVPAGFRPSQLPESQKSATIRYAEQVLVDDADNWLSNRLRPDSFQYVSVFENPATQTLLVRIAYHYSQIDVGSNVPGWSEVRIVGGRVECIRYHDRDGCTIPRPSRARQLDSLGRGQVALGPIPIPPPNCYRTEVRRPPSKPVYEVRRVGPGRDDVEKVLDHYEAQAPYIVKVFQCPARVYRLQCIAQGAADRTTESLFGVGSTRERVIRLDPGEEIGDTDFIRKINVRIADKSCVRTQ